jgi:F1F0 ATPase subunit 2
MSLSWVLLGGLAAGLLLGLLFFGGLWWTTQRLPASPRPALLLLGSFSLRVVLVGAGFFLLALWDWPAVLAAVVGFTLLRIFTARRWGPGALRGGEERVPHGDH